MIHPHTELRYISKTIGYGVVATAFIPKGTITWVLDKLDREFSPAEIAAMDKTYRDILDTYSYRNNKGNFILCWDNARFVNHSFKPSCFTTAYEFEIAIRDIHPGEQLTDDYGYLNVSEPFKADDEGTRRKTVYPDDLLTFGKAWDKKVLENFKKINKVEQPLGHMLDKGTWKTIEDVIGKKKEMKSLLTCYYKDKKQRS
ncbi:MAG: protein-lysine N-methyltransferase [Bacteroidetes bacterium]|nr:protein-lysine N-methyltransferase [Bacteroidota bacterium]